MNIERTLFWYISALVLLSLIAWQISFIGGQFLGLSFPYNTFLYYQGAQFTDFTIQDKSFYLMRDNGWIFQRVDQPYEFAYFPTSAYAFFIFYLLYPTAPVHAYLFSVVVMICIAAFTLGYALRSSPMAKMFWAVVLLTLLTSYPFMIMFDRANIEGMIWFFLFLGIVSFVNNRFIASGLFFAIAASMKVYPGIFLLLLLSKRKYKEFILAIFFLAVISIIATYELTGNSCTTYNMVLKGLEWFEATAILYRLTPGFEHSLFGLIKQIMFIFGMESQINYANVAYLYKYAVAFIFFLLYITSIRKLPFLNQLFSLTILGILLPFFSGDYTLIHLYIPWGIFLIFLAYDAKSSGFTTKQALNILIPCAIIFTPQSYLIIEGIGGFGGQVKALTLLYLLIVVLKNPMPSDTLFKESHSKA